MKKTTNPYNFLRNFCFRSPVLSLSFYEELIKKSSLEVNDLITLWDNPVIKEAIFLASKPLYDEIDKNVSISNFDKLATLKQSFLKYLFRASTRCTPFGLFSGIEIGEISDSTSLKLKPVDLFTRRTSFDTGYLFNLAAKYSKEESIKKNAVYYPNSSLYSYFNQYRFIDYSSEKNQRSYSIEGAHRNYYLDAIIDKSKTGSSYNELVASLISDEINEDEASNFIDTLIENQLLTNEIEVNITGNEDTFETLIKQIESCTASEELLSRLKSLQNSLDDLDLNIGNEIHLYDQIIKAVKDLNIDYNANYLFQTDLKLESVNNQLDRKIVYQIKKVIPFLLKLDTYKENGNLKSFKKSFINRYEDQEVSLNEVLDIESGIGYIQNSLISDTTPFLKDITPSQKRKTTYHFKLNEAEKIIIEKFLECKNKSTYTLNLKDEDFISIVSDIRNLPDTLSAFTEIIENDKGNFIVLHNLSACAGKLLGRFTHIKEIEEYVKKITSIEEKIHSDKILAEIVHLPESRVGNILRRTHLRDYEIPYISKSTLSQENQIHVNDLLVSVKNDRIILSSKKLEREIIPKLTNAHNYTLNALPVYEFLADLELQNQRESISFTWPSIIANHSFLPRVMYKNIILSKATWKLNKDTIPGFLESSEKETLSIIEKWQTENNVPDYIQIVQSDNTLLINLKHLDSLLILKNTLKKRRKIEIEEFLQMNNKFLRNTYGEYYTNECLFTFYNQLELNKN
ncbi:hypothetical protein BTO06_17945 [Tenacibaculum sp. SZ-18]|uniref:lantibiotic dehydratase family protein n=1 Tax=Tenacibaculum sp. SZ-18 TaxID=754423 RepID=UPI000C2CF0F9|nr:lantibiotic dehydratase family protein [Tenacibaculum sp. SZ-18]AUC16913.1 hypothetical protein BTO06_17945 [Tenacibaculum sp. SZ-18]